MTSRYVIVSGVVFGFLAVAQLLRALNKVPVQIGTVEVPIWVSWIVVVLASGMCAWAFASLKKGRLVRTLT